MKKIVLAVVTLLALPCLATSAPAAVTLNFYNKLKNPIRYIVGSQDEFTDVIHHIAPGKKSQLEISTENPQLLIWEADKPAIAYIYQFATTGKKSLKIRAVRADSGFRIEPQTKWRKPIADNVTSEDIKRVGAYKGTRRLTGPAEK